MLTFKNRTIHIYEVTKCFIINYRKPDKPPHFKCAKSIIFYEKAPDSKLEPGPDLYKLNFFAELVELLMPLSYISKNAFFK